MEPGQSPDRPVRPDLSPRFNSGIVAGMQDLTIRQRDILGVARTSGHVKVDDMAARFDVTPQTIRKDINELCDMKLLRRVHGGAMLASGVANVGYEARRAIASDEKQLIGALAARHIPDNCSLFINIGTTTEEVAKALLQHEGLLVITNNLHVANILLANQKAEIIIAGGVLRRVDGGITGEATIDLINQFMVDYAVIGASAIDEEGTLLDFDYREVRVTQAIIANSRKVFLVSDKLKIDRSAPVRIGHISQIDTFVTDAMTSDHLAQICAENGVRVECALPGIDEPDHEDGEA